MNAMEFKHFWYSLLKRGIVTNSNSATSNKKIKSHWNLRLHLQRKPGGNHTRTFSVLSLNYLSWAGSADKGTHFTYTSGMKQEKISWSPKIEGKFKFLRNKSSCILYGVAIWNSPLTWGKGHPCGPGCRLPCLYIASHCQGKLTLHWAPSLHHDTDTAQLWQEIKTSHRRLYAVQCFVAWHFRIFLLLFFDSRVLTYFLFTSIGCGKI